MRRTRRRVGYEGIVRWRRCQGCGSSKDARNRCGAGTRGCSPERSRGSTATPAPGATVEIVAAGGELLGRAAYSPASQIRARVWSFEPGEGIDAAFFRRRLARAIESRRRLELLEPGGACRLVFSESDGLPGLIVDRYGDYLVCQFLSAGAESWRATIVELLAELCCAARHLRALGGRGAAQGRACRRGGACSPAPSRRARSRSLPAICGSSSTSRTARRPALISISSATASG